MAAQLGAVILAAGASRRMGTPKALLPWAGTTLLEHAVEQARAAGIAHIVVVVGPDLEHSVSLAHVTVRCNPDPETGRSASIRIGSAALPDDVDAVIVQSVDQPCEADILARLCAALDADSADIAVPTHAGHRGHPVCLRGRLLSELRDVTEAEHGLRALVRRHVVLEVPVSTPSVIWNLNDPAAYAEARRAR